jgi:hypothetical protein
MASRANHRFTRTITQCEDMPVSGQLAMASTGQMLLSVHSVTEHV